MFLPFQRIAVRESRRDARLTIVEDPELFGFDDI